jgi:segregation and condensation protein B
MNERAEHARLIEALLFASPEPVSESELMLRLGDEADIPALLRELAEEYAARGINLVGLAGGWTFRTAPDLAGALRSERQVERRLSRAAVETLAVIAYHQPVTRAEIEAIRGVTIARGTLDRLLESGWVAPRGRRETPGRPLNWVTTPHFLAHFGLDALTELPGVEELRASGLLELGPAVFGDGLQPPDAEPDPEPEDEP